ncbi:uncharacterized protein HMPREF1541_04926 [Cyphellophora europaea CBS 101466]|uniref:Uncharacterized protein n=1 Tax=Cyphellophora europaea (strain CBS 101466) TaxID=1220924 RepID=W2RW17_CYPE1|nr:uncharacterized protein HMPREF1541_04926 [Cyphellophora europaea CBS 101466]ETN40647.1 hypothetical protein HMPREF1541_04926 [Cyphellophora europaea CBS 101466]
MPKRAREDETTTQQPKRAKTAASSNSTSTSKARYQKKGHYCPEYVPILAKGKDMNGGIAPFTQSTFTSAFPYDSEWSETNLPSILFHITPPPPPPSSSGASAPRPTITRSDGIKLTASTILPDHISVTTPSWLIGAWLRLDPTTTLSDVLARMSDDPTYPGGPIRKPKHSAMNNRLFRQCAKLFGHYCGGAGQAKNKNQREIRAGLTERMLQLNTTLEERVVPAAGPGGEVRLVRKKLVSREKGTTSVRAVNVEVTERNWRETTFPLDFFVLNKENGGQEVAATPCLSDGPSPASSGGEEAATPASASASPLPVGPPLVAAPAAAPAKPAPEHELVFPPLPPLAGAGSGSDLNFNLDFALPAADFDFDDFFDFESASSRS